jgi:branched-chain amino acid aminotransferase
MEAHALHQQRLIWFKGKLLPASEAHVSVLSPTAQFGLNVFEGIRGYWNDKDTQLYLFRLFDHLERLFQSCRLIGLKSPYSIDDIASYIIDLIRVNRYTEDIAIRATLFVDGEGSWSSSEPVDLFIAPIAKNRRDPALGLSACISTWERINDRAMPPRAKIGANYINGRYAHIEATKNGYDLAILLDRDGKVTEGAGSCIFLVRDGTLITPAITASVLESITRDTIIRLALVEGISVVERQVDRTELMLADEIFVCGSAVEVTPLVTLDRMQVGAGVVGETTLHLAGKYLSAVSNIERSPEGWLTPVYADPNRG